MIVSPEYGFIFVHVPKTAGMSVTDAFAPFGCGRNRCLWRSLTRRLPFHEAPEKAHFRVHDPVCKIIRKLGRDTVEQFVTFSVVRNPFEHAVSHFEYMKQFRIRPVARKVAAMSFEEYLAYRRKPPSLSDTIFARMPAQSYYLTDPDGQLAVKRIIRFEQLEPGLTALASELGLPEFRLRHVNKTKAKSKARTWQSYYTPACVEMVREIYAPDFRLLGFSPEGPDLPA